MGKLIQTIFLLAALFISACSKKDEYIDPNFPDPFPQFDSYNMGRQIAPYFDRHQVPSYHILKDARIECYKRSNFTFECLDELIAEEKKALAKQKGRDKIESLEKIYHLMIAGSDHLEVALSALEYARQAVFLAKKMTLERERSIELHYGLLLFHIGDKIECSKLFKDCFIPVVARSSKRAAVYYQEAAEIFLRHLDDNPRDQHIKLLYNLSQAQLDQKPLRHSIKEIAKEVYKPSIRYTNVSKELGLHRFSTTAGGAIVDDFNGDLYMDFIVTSLGFSLYYQYSQKKGCYEDLSKEAGISHIDKAIHATQVDYDNDGDLDLYFHRGSWPRKGDPIMRNNLMINNGKGVFTEYTKESGLWEDRSTNVASVWSDYNKDGFVDVFVCNENYPARLFTNVKGKFQDSTKKSGIENEEQCKGASWGDMNEDGWPDLVIANFKSRNKVYLNNKDGTFSKGDYPRIEKYPKRSFTSWFFDYNNDGREDLFISSHNSNPHHFVESFYGRVNRKQSQRLYLNEGKGSFRDVTSEANLKYSPMTMGATYGDLDNNGYLDILLGTGDRSVGAVVPNLVWSNVNGQRFENITFSSGLGYRKKGHAINVTDIDNDGDKDLLISLGGNELDKSFPHLLINENNLEKNWITLELEGGKSNRSAIDALVEVRVKDGNKTKSFFRKVSHGSSFGSQSLRIEVGLEKASNVESVIVKWPSGQIDKHDNLLVNQFYRIVEGKKEVVKQILKVIPKSHFRICKKD